MFMAAVGFISEEINKANGCLTLTVFETGEVEYFFNTPDAALNERIMLWLARTTPTN